MLSTFPSLLALTLLAPGVEAEKPQSRSFRFTYAATVTGLKPGSVARIWLPVPPSNADQDAKIQLKPAEATTAFEPKYSNEVLYLEARAGADGTVPVKVVYGITRREVKGTGSPPVKNLDDLARFLKPDAMVPIDGKPLELIKDRRLPEDPMATAHVLYDVVNHHMRYSKEGTGWGRGDAVWACDSKFGNCSDFHSLFISLARSRGIPSVFEIGFPLPEKLGSGEIAGYHCWAKFYTKGKGWVPVDISEANKNPEMQEYYFGNLTSNRIAFSTGRDLTLVPKQDGKPVNFLIYPYVEVGGQPYDKIEKKFTYEDVK